MKNKFNISEESDDACQNAIACVESGMYQTVTDEDVLEEYADHLISNYITILAIKLTNYWREFFPYSADAWMYSGLALSQKIGQEKNAEDTFKKAISLSPLEADYYLELGSFYESFEEYEESLNCYLDAASRIFNVPDIYYAIGIVYGKMNRFIESRDAFLDCLQIDELFAEAWLYLATTYQVLDEKNDAVEAFQKFVALEPDDPSGWELLGDSYAQLDMLDNALASYDRAVSLTDQPESALYAKGYLLLVHKKFNESIVCFKKALEYNSSILYPLLHLGIVLQEAGNSKDAIHYFQQAISQFKTLDLPAEIVCNTWYELSFAYYSLNDYKNALNAINHALTLIPDETSYLALWNKIKEEM